MSPSRSVRREVASTRRSALESAGPRRRWRVRSPSRAPASLRQASLDGRTNAGHLAVVRAQRHLLLSPHRTARSADAGRMGCDPGGSGMHASVVCVPRPPLRIRQARSGRVRPQCGRNGMAARSRRTAPASVRIVERLLVRIRRGPSTANVHVRKSEVHQAADPPESGRSNREGLLSGVPVRSKCCRCARPSPGVRRLDTSSSGIRLGSNVIVI